jgi:hypothetical protein
MDRATSHVTAAPATTFAFDTSSITSPIGSNT